MIGVEGSNLNIDTRLVVIVENSGNSHIKMGCIICSVHGESEYVDGAFITIIVHVFWDTGKLGWVDMDEICVPKLPVGKFRTEMDSGCKHLVDGILIPPVSMGQIRKTDRNPIRFNPEGNLISKV